jgi:hypothetical protein
VNYQSFLFTNNAQVIVLKTTIKHRYTIIIILTSVTLTNTNNGLPEDGVTAPKHVGAILK